MRKIITLIVSLLACMLFCGCEALSLAENAQPYFAGEEFVNSENYYKDYYYPMSSFEAADAIIFQPTSYGMEYLDEPLSLAGTVEKTFREDGIKYYQFSTEYGTIYISNKLFTLDKIKDGTAVRMYFVYSGYNENLEGITGAYVSYSIIA